MSAYVLINEIIGNSSVYGECDNALEVERVLVLPNASIVKYTYDGNKFIHVWVCENGLIWVEDSTAPTHEYSLDDDNEYRTLSELLDCVPL